MLRIATKEYFEALEHFEQYLPAGKDTELLTLKGHLLIERMLEKYLSQNLPKPEELQESGFRFSQKLALVAALNQQTESVWLWSALRTLNRLRNELAHQIDSVKFGKLVDQFVAEVAASPELPRLEPPRNIEEQLHRALFAVHEAMSFRVNL